MRRRPGLRELSAEDFWVQEKKDFERLPKCRKYLAERRRRPAPAAMRAHMATLGALPDGGVASAEVAAEVNAEAVQVSRNAPPGALAERVLGARSAAVAKRARELALSAFDEYMADRIDAAEFDRRKAEARAKATAEHAPLTELERASAEYIEAVFCAHQGRGGSLDLRGGGGRRGGRAGGPEVCGQVSQKSTDKIYQRVRHMRQKRNLRT